MARFFSESPLVAGTEARLSSEESHHLAKVLRMEVGEAIELVDGKGGVARATLVTVSAKAATARVESLLPVPARSRLTLCFAVAKGPAVEFLVRRATEVGIAALQPLVTQHSIHPKEWNEARWQRQILEVAKQCQEPWFPELRAPRKLGEWLGAREKHIPLVFCDEARRDAPLPVQGASACDLLVGAEGGWSDEERRLVADAGAVPLGLGRNRLRAETAALVAVVLLKERLGEL